MDMNKQLTADAAMPVYTPQAVGSEQVKKLTSVLQKYKGARARTESRIVAAENWWKIRNTAEEQKTTQIGADGGFTASSGWLHNVIVSKHADAMESYPEPNILPREEGDRGEARMLTSIVPCILEQNHFEETYSNVAWRKIKSGTGVYKVVWDSSKLNGLGDVEVTSVNLLNLYFEPGVTDIQDSRYVFHTEVYDKDVLQQMYPDLLKDKLRGQQFISTKFLYDDSVDMDNKSTVIDVYYHKYLNGRKVLHYIKYVDDIILYATENDPQLVERGLYDHGLYPYVFDALYPIEGSPCGYGYVDICRNPQTEIDLIKTSMVKNAMVGSTPRYFSRVDGSINESEFLDLSKAIVHVNGNTDDSYLRRIDFNPLDSVYLGVLDRTIQELRETSGNTETSTGSVSSGVTAASAIAALQEASGKGSRDSTQTSYRAYAQVVHLVIELIRQFYDLPRKFRILGQYGTEQYVSYSNEHIQPMHQGNDFGTEMGYRMPLFDIRVTAQRRNIYTKVSQNELGLQFFQMGFFDPNRVDQALMCIDMMDFDGKDGIMQKIARQGTMYQKLTQYMQLALMLTQQVRPDMVQSISNDIMQTLGASPAMNAAAAPQMVESDNIAGIGKEEPTLVKNARERSNNASQPDEGKVINTEGRK